MRLSTYCGETYPGADLTEPEVEFLQAMAKFQKITGRRYPSWREVLGVVHALGYRRLDLHAPTATPPALEVQP